MNVTAKGQVFVLLYGSQRNNSENSNQDTINFEKSIIKYLKLTGRQIDNFDKFDRSMFNNRQ